MNGLMIIWAVALNTFREAARSRVLHAVVAVAACGVLASIAVGKMSLESDARVVRDLGTSLFSLTLVTVAILSGVTFMYKDIGRKTIYTVVTKPISRAMYLVGKYVGLLLTIGACGGALGGVFLTTVLVRGDEFGVVLLQSMWLSYLEAAIVAAFATLCSSFSTPILSGLMTFGVFVLGRLRDELLRFGRAYKDLKTLFDVFAIPLPNLPLFRTDIQVAYPKPLTWEYVFYCTGYAAIVIGGLLMLSSALFARRDFV